MVRKLTIFIMLLCLNFSKIAFAKNSEKIKLSNHDFLVISVGNFESASIGSYSVSIFNDKNLTDFKAGGVFERNGSVFNDKNQARINFKDINNDKKPEIIITILTAGSGNYVTIDALKINEKMQVIEKISSIKTTTNEQNYIELLRQNYQNNINTYQ